MNNIGNKAHIKSTKTETKFFFIFLLLLLLTSFLDYYKPSSSSFTIFKRTWGFDNITYFSFFSQGLIVIISLLIIFPKTNEQLLNIFTYIARQFAKNSKRKIIIFILISFVSIFLFYIFRVKYFFLGDFNLRLQQVINRDFLKTEYLTMKMLYYFSLIGLKYGCSAFEMFVLYSCIMGGIFVFFGLLIADILGKNSLQKVFYFLCFLGTPLILIFCGYIEIYATPIVFLSIYIYFGLRYLKFKQQFYLVVLSLFFALGSHILTLAAVPSIFILFYFNNKSKFDFITSMSNKKIAAIIAVLILIVLILAFTFKIGFILPLLTPTGKPDYLCFFSFKHFWEIFNGQMLCCGISFVFIFYLLFKAVKEKTKIAAHQYFLLSITGCFLLIILIANLQRGSSDWDIMAFTAVTLAILNSSLINIVFKNKLNLLNYLQVTIIGLNLINTTLWVNINHTDLSIKKIENMLLNDPGTYYTKFSSSTQLAIIYKENHLEEEADRILFNACNGAVTDLAPCVIYAKNLIGLKKYELARQSFEQLMTKSEFIPEAHIFLLEYHDNHNNKDKFELYLNKLFTAFMKQPEFFLSKVKPKEYLKYFEYLYNLESLKKNYQKLDSLNFAIGNLKKSI